MYPNIKGLRVDGDLSQSDIAEILNISQTTYSRYESGILATPAEALIKIARHYGTSVDYLLGLTDEKKPYPAAKRGKK